MLLYFIIYFNFSLRQINFTPVIFKKESIDMEAKVKNYLMACKKDKDLTNEKSNIECGLDWSKAPLKGWDLSGLKLSAYQGRAKFQYAILTNAFLTKTTLKSAFLSQAELQGANLVGAKLQGADLVGAKLQGAILVEAKLQGANLAGTKLQGANLSGANLQGAILSGANLQGAILSGANLQGANLGNTNLRDAIFDEKTILAGVDFFQCTLDGSTIKNAYKNMDKEVVQARTIKNKKNYPRAREIYILLKNYFSREGMYDVSGEYFIQEKKTEKILNKKRKEWGKYFLNIFLEIVSGYGEKPLNAIICSLIIILGSADIYWLFNGIMATNSKITFGGTFLESFYFSLVTFATLGYGDLIPKAGFFRIIASFESLMGVVLTAIFIFIFARKTTR